MGDPSAVDAPAVRQARALGDPTRHRLFRAIADADEPLDVATLTDLVGLHHTAVRNHLSVLRDAGLVLEEPERRDRPGRPRLLYRPDRTLDGAWDAPDHYRWLALLLAAASRDGDVRRTGREAAAHEAVPERYTPFARLAGWAEGLGFAPRVEEDEGRPCALVLGHCPVADAAALNPDAVCTLHLGLAEGVADRIGAIEVDALERHDPHTAGCKLRVRATGQPSTDEAPSTPHDRSTSGGNRS